MKLLTKLYFMLATLLLLAGCQAGLVYEEVPENVYSNVSLGGNMCNIASRKSFKNQIYSKGWDKWVDEYICQSTIGNYQGTGKQYTNKTSESLTILGTIVAPGASIQVKNTLTIENDPTAPDGKLYVINAFADRYAIYNHHTSSYMFVASKFTGDFILVDKDGKNVTESQSAYIKMPIDEKALVVTLVMSDTNGGYQVEPVNGAPTLGLPGDFSQPRKYLVTNITRRPDGQPAAQRMYEIRIQFLP